MKKNYRADQLVLPYLEEELKPKRILAWVLAVFTAFLHGALFFPFYA